MGDGLANLFRGDGGHAAVVPKGHSRWKQGLHGRCWRRTWCWLPRGGGGGGFCGAEDGDGGQAEGGDLVHGAGVMGVALGHVATGLCVEVKGGMTTHGEVAGSPGAPCWVRVF